MKVNLLTEFKEYLKTNGKTMYERNRLSATTNSIFSNKSKFEDFLKERYNVETTVSMKDILEAEIVDGKLVIEEVEEEDKEDAEAMTGNVGEIEADEKEVDETDDETEEAEETEDSEETEKPSAEDLMKEMLNELLDNEDVKNAVDINKDGKLDDTEIKSFLEAINGYDNDDENLSLDDLFSAYSDITHGRFDLLDDKNEEVAETQPSATGAADTTGTGATGASGASSSGGVGGGSGVSGSAGAAGSNGVEEKNLNGMSKDELNAELTKAQDGMKEKQDALSAILDGSDSKVQELQKNVDESYEKYQEELQKADEELAKQIDDIKTQIDSKDQEISAKEQEIANQETTISECENSYNNAVSTRQTLETTLAALQSADAGDDESKQAELASQIADVTAQIEQAKTAEEEAKKAWDEAKEQLETLNQEKEQLTTERDELNSQMDELEAQVVEEHPEVKQYQENYDKAKESLEEYKETAATQAKADVQEAQKYVNDIKTAITDYDNKQTVKGFCGGEFGKDILDFAKSFIGCNEADGSANKFLNGASSAQIPWCAAFVEYVMENSGNYDDVPDWYKNIDNKWYCPNVYNAAKNADAIISAQDAQPGDIVLFDWDGDGHRDHIGIVESTDNGKVITVEGNSSNKVQSRTYEINDGRLTFCKVV